MDSFYYNLLNIGKKEMDKNEYTNILKQVVDEETKLLVKKLLIELQIGTMKKANKKMILSYNNTWIIIYIIGLY